MSALCALRLGGGRSIGSGLDRVPAVSRHAKGDRGGHLRLRSPRAVVRVQAAQRGGLPELDVAVFRFTLGIPGFDDAQLPRIIATLAAVLLAANHVASGVVSAAQSRTELLGAVLAAACFALPEIGARLNRAAGRRANAGQLAGARELFAVDASLPEATRQELAWASLALLRNTNADGFLVLAAGPAAGEWRAIAARGAVRAPTFGDPTLAQLSAAATAASREDGGQSLAGGDGGVAYWPTVASAPRGLANGGDVLPDGAACVLTLPCGPGYAMMLWAGEEDAFPPRQRAWAGAVAKKVGGQMAARGGNDIETWK